MAIDIQIKYITNSRGERFFTQRWIPSRPKALITLVHGFGDHSGRYSHVINHFARQGYAVSAYDLRGHGLSDGRRGDCESFDQHVFDLHSFIWETAHEVREGTPVVVVAMGVGAVIAMHYATTYPRAIAGIVAVAPTLAPNIRAKSWQRWLGNKVGNLLPRLPVEFTFSPADLTRDAEAIAAYQEDPYVFQRLSMRAYRSFKEKINYVMPLAFRLRHPLMIVQAKEDRISSSEASERFFSEVIQDNKRLVLLNGAFHEPFNDMARGEAFAAVDDWLTDAIVGKGHATGVTGKGWNLK